MFIRNTFLWSLLTLALLTSAAFAQTQTISIQDGNVYLNGQLLPAESVPASLQESTVTLHLTIPEGATPTFALNDRNYIIKDQQVQEVTVISPNAINDTAVIFRQRTQPSPYATREAATVPLEGDAEDNVYYSNVSNPFLEQYVIELQNHAEQLQELSSDVPQRQAMDLMEEMETQARAMSQFAQELAFVEMQSYLSDVEAQNQELYRELVREAQLENQARNLAIFIRTLPEGEERIDAINQLYNLLAEIFEIKQNNRYREIAEIEALLENLQERYSSREDLKEQIIEKRMNELIGPHR